MTLLRAALLIIGVCAVLVAALFAAPLARGQDTRYVCTEFIGYSQAWNFSAGGWGGAAAVTMNAGGADRVQARWQSGGAAFRWADPNYAGWTDPTMPQNPCDSSAGAPDRLILDITHNDYLDTTFTDPNGVPANADAWMEQTIRSFVATAKARKPSAANNIVLQPVVGGPNHTVTCATSGAPQHGVVRASYNHPTIWAAAQRVAANTPGVTLGYDPHVRTCSDYADWEGHLVASASSPIGTTIGTYYRDLRASTPTVIPTIATVTPTSTATPTNTPTSVATQTATPTVTATAPPVGPTATPEPTCFGAIRVSWDGTWTAVGPVPCPPGG